MRMKERKKVTRIRMKVTRSPMRGPQEVLEITILSSFPRIGLSLNFYPR